MFESASREYDVSKVVVQGHGLRILSWCQLVQAAPVDVLANGTDGFERIWEYALITSTVPSSQRLWKIQEARTREEERCVHHDKACGPQ